MPITTNYSKNCDNFLQSIIEWKFFFKYLSSIKWKRFCHNIRMLDALPLYLVTTAPLWFNGSANRTNSDELVATVRNTFVGLSGTPDVKEQHMRVDDISEVTEQGQTGYMVCQASMTNAGTTRGKTNKSLITNELCPPDTQWFLLNIASAMHH